MHFRNRKKIIHDVYISDPIDTDKDGNSLTLMDLMADETSIIDSIDLKMKSETLYKFIKEQLEPREQQILIMRYGLFATIPLTQREVANELNISRSYVSRLEKKALEKLRAEFERTNK